MLSTEGSSHQCDPNEIAIDRGSIHNPEYFRYLTQLNAVDDLMRVEDVACGELPPYRLFISRIPDVNYAPRFAETFYACIEHIRALPLAAQPPMHHGNLDLRVAYINGAFDEAAFWSKVKLRHKRDIKRTAFRELLQFVITIMVASARNIAFTPSTFVSEVETMVRFVELVEEDYIPRLLNVHGGAVPREIGLVFTDAFLKVCHQL